MIAVKRHLSITILNSTLILTFFLFILPIRISPDVLEFEKNYLEWFCNYKPLFFEGKQHENENVMTFFLCTVTKEN